METVIEMLEAMVSQGEAQFKCGDKYATFTRQAIVQAREVLDQRKNAMTFSQANDAIKKICDNTLLDSLEKFQASTYLVGYEGGRLGDSVEKSQQILSKLVGKTITF